MATTEEVKGWLTGRLPKEWFAGAPEIRMDEDEIWVIGTLPDVQASGGADAVKAAREGAIQRKLRVGQRNAGDLKFGLFVGRRSKWHFSSGQIDGEQRTRRRHHFQE